MASFRSSLGLATTGYFVALAYIQRSSQSLQLIRWDLLPVFNNPPRSAEISNSENAPREEIIKSSLFKVLSPSRYSRIISDCSSLMAQLPEADCYILDEDRVECQSLKWFKGVLNRELITSNLLSILYSERRCVLPSLKLLSELDSQQQSSQSPTSNSNAEIRPLERPLLVLPYKSIVERHFGQPRSESIGERALCEPIVRSLLFDQPLALSSPCRSPLLSGRLGNLSVPEPLDLPAAHVLECYDSLRHLPPAASSPEPSSDATETSRELVSSRLFQREYLCRAFLNALFAIEAGPRDLMSTVLREREPTETKRRARRAAAPKPTTAPSTSRKTKSTPVLQETMAKPAILETSQTTA